MMRHATPLEIQKARRLFVKEGLTPIQVAAKMDREINTVRIWIKKGGWNEEREAFLKGEEFVNIDDLETRPVAESKDSKQKKAFVLFAEKGYTAGEICKLLKISNTLVSSWINAGKWTEKREANRDKENDIDVTLLETRLKMEPINMSLLKAEFLYTQKGYEVAEIARMLLVSEALVGIWIENYNWFSVRNEYVAKELQKLEGLAASRTINDSMATKQAKAKYLLLVKGFTQKEIAALCGVSEKTLCQWVKKWGWKDKEAKKYNLKGGFAGLMEGFVNFVQSEQPERKKDVLKLWGKYLLKLEDLIDE